MQPRMNPYRAAPALMKALEGLESEIQRSGLEMSLLDLVKTRASQVNGCAYCIHLHTREARSRGDSEARLYLLDAWRESPLYTDRERAALEWTEAVTQLDRGHVADAVYESARQHLNETELACLTVAVATINAWNRIAISCRSVHPSTVRSGAA